MTSPVFAEDVFWQSQPIVKNPDGTYVVVHDADQGARSYHVCPLDVDPANAYDVAEVAAFWESLSDGDPRKQAYEPPPAVPVTLDEAKVAKKAAIDATTNRIRDRDGLAYAGERFDMRDTAMLKWTGLIAAKDMLPFPMTILTIDDKPFVLANQTALMQFAGAVLSYETSPDSPLSTGRALRARVVSAQTVAEVEAVIDDRD